MTYTIDNGNPTPLSTGDRWTPILDGDVFCAPACGHKCTRAAFDHATAAAAALVAALGDGWAPRVYENGGWHYEANKGAATVAYFEHKGAFDAEVRASKANGQTAQFFANGSSPREALENALALVDEEIALLKRARTSATLEALTLTAD